MTKDNSVESESAERKEYAQQPVLLRSRHLYPDWETVGEPFDEWGKTWVMIRKHISLSGKDDDLN